MISSATSFEIQHLFKKFSAKVCLVLGVFLILTSCMAWSGTLICTRCGKPIIHEYISSGQRYFHPACMACEFCGKPIRGKFTLNGKDLYHPDCHIKAKNLVCDYCSKPLDHNWMESNGKTYHPDCFKQHVQLRCGICGKPIEGNYIRDKGVFHERCYKEIKLDRCAICSLPIEGRHLVDTWGNKAHIEHQGHSVEICGSCGRIMDPKVSKGAFHHKDGRNICGICLETAVNNLKSIDRVTSSVLALFSTVGIDGLPTPIPVSLVDLTQLKLKSGNRFNNSARGFTLSTVKTQNDAPPVIDHSIYILNGLPLTEFKAVLAHELLHVWLIENDIDLPAREMEGFCNLGAMLVDQSEKSAFAQVLLSQLETNPDPVYGAGYRIMKKKLDRFGWEGLIRKLVLNSR